MEVVNANGENAIGCVPKVRIFPLDVPGEVSVPAIARNDTTGDPRSTVVEAATTSVEGGQGEQDVAFVRIARMSYDDLVFGVCGEAVNFILSVLRHNRRAHLELQLPPRDYIAPVFKVRIVMQ